MYKTRLAMLLAAGLLAACAGGPGVTSTPPSGVTSTPPSGTPATGSPTTGPTASGQPSGAPTDAPASLDASQSDADVVGQVTLANDEFGDRDGTYTVIGLAGDGSDCSPTLDGDEFIAVAWVDDAPNGEIHQFGVSVAIDAIPDTDGQTPDVDGRVSFDFVSESGFGTLYYGDSSQADSGSSTIDVTRAGDALRFDFEGATGGDATFSGVMLCGEPTL